MNETKEKQRFVIPRDELEYLYKDCDHTAKQLAELYNTTRSFIYSFLHKYGIKKRGDADFKLQRKLKRLKERGITKESLSELYHGGKMTPKEIGIKFGYSYSHMNSLLHFFDIPTRSKKEVAQLTWDKYYQQKLQEKENKTIVQKKITTIKQQIKNGKLNPSEITHQKACVLLSCEPGIEKLKKLCALYGFDFTILTNTYRKLEPIWYKLNEYPLINAKIAIALYLRYKISKQICSEICHVTAVSFRTFYDKLEKRIKLTKEKREDPLTINNIRWLFDNPDLPEIYSSLPVHESYLHYYCNIDLWECHYRDSHPTSYKCDKPKFFRCQYAFFKTKK